MESGISVVGLCHAGRWKSLTTAQEYIEDSTVEKNDRADRLDGKIVESKNTRIKLGDSTDESQGHTTVQSNQYIINITGDGTSSHY